MSQSGCMNSPNQSPTCAFVVEVRAVRRGFARQEIHRRPEQRRIGRAVERLLGVRHAVDEPAGEVLAHARFESLSVGARDRHAPTLPRRNTFEHGLAVDLHAVHALQRERGMVVVEKTSGALGRHEPDEVSPPFVIERFGL